MDRSAMRVLVVSSGVLPVIVGMLLATSSPLRAGPRTRAELPDDLLSGSDYPTEAERSQPAGDDIEEVVVIGSRLRRRDHISPSPIATVPGEAFAYTGQQTLETALSQMPQFTPSFDRTANNPGNGRACINLRGLGPQRTLVMLNGRRVAPNARSADYLGFEAGYRYSKYEHAGSVDTYKAGLEWYPIAGFGVRSMFQRAVRAPNLREAFEEETIDIGLFVTADSREDPCSASSDPVGDGNVEKCIATGLPEE